MFIKNNKTIILDILPNLIAKSKKKIAYLSDKIKFIYELLY